MNKSRPTTCPGGLDPDYRTQFVAEYPDGPCPVVATAMCDSWQKGSSSAYNNGADIEAAKQPIIDHLLPGTCRNWHLDIVHGGTAANKAILEQCCTRRDHGLVCSEFAHVYTMERNAVSAMPMLVKADKQGSQAGCMDVADLERVLLSYSPSMHTTRPVALTLTQPNEFGVIYSRERLEQIIACVREFRERGRKLFFHIDASRLHNVLAQDDRAEEVRVVLEFADAATIGICKDGGPDCDAALFLSDTNVFDNDWVEEFHGYLKSNTMHNCRGWDKAAGVVALFNGPYLDNARHANEAAAVLGRRMREIQQFARIEIKYEVQTNAVFLDADASVLNALAENWRFARGLPGAAARFICSWKTRIDDVHELADDFRNLLIDRLNACDGPSDPDRAA